MFRSTFWVYVDDKQRRGFRERPGRDYLRRSGGTRNLRVSSKLSVLGRLVFTHWAIGRLACSRMLWLSSPRCSLDANPRTFLPRHRGL